MRSPYRRIYLAARQSYLYSQGHDLRIAAEDAASAAFTAAQRQGFSRLDLRRISETATWQATGIIPGDFVAQGMM
jgi:hypothetical protein